MMEKKGNGSKLPRIYVCHTYYHVYVTFLKELALLRQNGGDREKAGRADLVLSKMSNDFEDLKSRVEKVGLFRRVIEFDEKREDFFPGLVKYMNSGPVVAMVWEGLNVVKTGRVMLGETNPADSKPGTIRGDFCIQVGRNIIHGSDSVESAEKEIHLWFKPEELIDYKSCAHDWVYE